ncbi:ATP-binding cassette domain-containing protein, partial [uncultured Spongiibacter sp.]|uniref:ATP-binding cassette domain-containing protein n=1 Tax=uncultured Spongiibacter sp. TaxID=870896 RepID=UPI0025864DD9
IVQQDIFIHAASVRDNIAYGRVDALKEQVEAAAKVAPMHDFIMSLPEGYDSPVGERGVSLSGGQKQRLSIARSLLQNPPTLLLDDSTSSVDVETERQIHEAMIGVMKGRTTIVIAHRLSTIESADQIVVMEEGRILERGSHADLLALGQRYAQLYNRNFEEDSEA